MSIAIAGLMMTGCVLSFGVSVILFYMAMIDWAWDCYLMMSVWGVCGFLFLWLSMFLGISAVSML